MFSKTKMSYGVNEVLLASVLGSVVFSLLAAQPLVIVGVTGQYQLKSLWFHAHSPRSNYSLQLYSLRHCRAQWYSILPIHGLDRDMVPHHALDLSRHQLMQGPDLCHPIFL